MSKRRLVYIPKKGCLLARFPFLIHTGQHDAKLNHTVLPWSKERGVRRACYPQGSLCLTADKNVSPFEVHITNLIQSLNTPPMSKK
ncbi:hypothetical protein IAQ61_000962 [Plenodomus lingam]|uniref:uncharacterized protein n=1 Tax=Leptosphaeria maculans TaxID=5022 RepID=UPI003332CAA7|nr:hypothetical protein IAQ61_000962 [Plenodomus lingam]